MCYGCIKDTVRGSEAQLQAMFESSNNEYLLMRVIFAMIEFVQLIYTSFGGMRINVGGDVNIGVRVR